MLLAGLVLLPTNLVAYAWMGGLAAALWAVALGTADGGWRKFAAGVLAAGALLFRADLGLAVLLPSVVLAGAMSARERRLFGAGIVLGLMPLAGLAVVVGPVQLYENLFHFPVLHSGRRLPIEAGWMLSLLCLHFAACAFAIGFGWMARRADREDARALTLLALGLCALGGSHQALQRFDPVHLFFTCFPSVALLPLAWLTALGLRSPAGAGRPLPATAVALLLVAVASPPLIGSVRQAIAFRTGAAPSVAPVVAWNARTFPLRSAHEVGKFALCLETVQRHCAPGERLFVGPRDLRHPHYNDTFLYHLLPQLTPATYFLEMNPGSVDRPDSRLVADVASADWLILNRDWDARGEGHAGVHEIVLARFDLLHAGAGLEVYRRSARTAQR
jgi:hypothetical protein